MHVVTLYGGAKHSTRFGSRNLHYVGQVVCELPPEATAVINPGGRLSRPCNLVSIIWHWSQRWPLAPRQIRARSSASPRPLT